jgi:hypothetical protein
MGGGSFSLIIRTEEKKKRTVRMRSEKDLATIQCTLF